MKHLIYVILFSLVIISCEKDTTENTVKPPVVNDPLDSLRKMMLGNWVNRKAFVDGKMIVNDAAYILRITKDTFYRKVNPNIPFASDTLEKPYIYTYMFINKDSLSFTIKSGQDPFPLKRNIYIYNMDSMMIPGIVESNLPIFPRAGDLILTIIK